MENSIRHDSTGDMRVRPHANEGIRPFLDSVRRSVEVHALQACIDRLQEDDFRQLEEIVRRMKECHAVRDGMAMDGRAMDSGDFDGGDFDEMDLADLDMAFHRYFVTMSGQPRLLAIWSESVRAMRREGDVSDDPMTLVDQCDTLVRLLRRGDKKGAVERYQSRGKP